MELEDILEKTKAEETAIRTEYYKTRDGLRHSISQDNDAKIHYAPLKESDKELDNKLKESIANSEKRDEINQRVVDVIALLPDKAVLELYETENRAHKKDGYDLTERGPVELLMEDMHKEAGVQRTGVDLALLENPKQIDANRAKRYMATPNLQDIPTPTDYLMGRSAKSKNTSMDI